MFAYKLLLIVAATIVCNTSALDIRSKSNLREGENVAVVAAKMYRHQASVQPKKGAKWEEALYHRRPSVKVPKGKSEDGGSVSLIGSGEAGERFKIECEMKLCTQPSKITYIKNDGTKMVSKRIEVSQEFNLDFNPNYLVDFGSGHADTVVRLMSRNSVLAYPKKGTSPLKEPMLFF